MSEVTKHSKEGQNGKNIEKSFVWTEEVILLLHVILDYKTSTAAAGLDWETIKGKYEEITELFQERYPKEGSSANEQEFPNFRHS